MIQEYIHYFLRKKRAVPRLLRGVFDRVVLGKPHLRVAEIALTFQCNSACVMCSCSKFLDIEKEKHKMKISDYESLGHDLDRLSCVSVNITGGEPLMRTDAGEIITALNPVNKIVNLVTNGINLSRANLKEYKKRGIDSLVVSLESTNPAENDAIRNYPGHFEVVMRTMKWAREEHIPYGISLTLGDYNFDKIYEMIAFAEDNAVFLCIAHGGSIGNWADNRSIFLSHTNAEKILSLIRKHKNMKIDFSANLNLRAGCPAIKEKIYITPYGDVLPCTFNPISFGNVQEESLPDIWKRMIEFYAKNINEQTLCLRTYNKDYIHKFLTPIKDMQQPVLIDAHPHVIKKRDS
ncbi:MAG: radical SAM protein [bacterium]